MKHRNPAALLRAALAFAGFCACSPQVHTLSQRNPDLFEKESDRFVGRATGPGDEPPKLFVRKREIQVKRLDRPNETGSLFNPDDERNYLFTSQGPLNVGRFLDIRILAGRAEEKPGIAGKKPAGAGSSSGSGSGDALTQELLKALPELTPAAGKEGTALKDFKMKIVHRYDNGDVLAMAERSSQVGDQINQTTVQARIPYDRLAAGDHLTTEDLLDVKFTESRDGEVADRASSGWQDEYALRLSGFDEAKSKYAQEVDDKHKQLDEARGKLETQIKSFGNERAQMTKQREEILKKSAEQTSKAKEMEDQLKAKDGKIEDQTKTIEDQTNEIKKLEEKPGDKKEATNG